MNKHNVENQQAVMRETGPNVGSIVPDCALPLLLLLLFTYKCECSNFTSTYTKSYVNKYKISSLIDQSSITPLHSQWGRNED